jgi:hypothetical protein
MSSSSASTIASACLGGEGERLIAELLIACVASPAAVAGLVACRSRHCSQASSSAPDRVESERVSRPQMLSGLHLSGIGAHVRSVHGDSSRHTRKIGIEIPVAHESKPRKRPGCGGLDTMPHIFVIAHHAKKVRQRAKRAGI